MRFDAPPLPVSVEVRWRALAPLRFSIHRLLVLIVVVGVGCGLVAEFRRQGRAIEYHRPRVFRLQPEGARHAAPLARHTSARLNAELLLLIYVAAVGPVALAFLAGRSIARFGGRGRRARPMDRPRAPHGIPQISPNP